jgi:glucan phosphorylase
MITTHDTAPSKIAYFSMEVGIGAQIPTYSGGLGVLAGDTIRAAADLKVPMVAVTLLHRKGYFYQRLDANGWQSEEPVEWVVQDFLIEMTPRIAVTIAERTVRSTDTAWQPKGSLKPRPIGRSADPSAHARACGATHGDRLDHPNHFS